MITALNKNKKTTWRRLYLVGKLLFSVLIVFILVRQIENGISGDFTQSISVHNMTTGRWFMAFMAVALMPLNWFFEAMKWKNLIHFEQMTWTRAYRGVLAGVAVSILTPNRIGEYAGRILFVRPENRWNGIFSTLAGSYIQWWSVGVLGVLGGLYYLLNVKESSAGETIVWCVLTVAMIFTAFFFLLYMDKGSMLIKKWTKGKWPFAQRIINYLANLDRMHIQKATVFACIRIATYSTQFYLIVLALGERINVIDGSSAALTTNILQTFMPLPPVIGLVGRGEAAVLVWSVFSADELIILSATFIVWVINVVLPALIGVVLILNLKKSK